MFRRPGAYLATSPCDGEGIRPYSAVGTASGRMGIRVGYSWSGPQGGTGRGRANRGRILEKKGIKPAIKQKAGIWPKKSYIFLKKSLTKGRRDGMIARRS